MAISSSAQNKGQTTRGQIIEVALAVASREGLSGLTIGELAKSVGMSKSGLFAHFRGIDALQLAVLEAAVARFIKTVMRPAFEKPRGEARLLALVKNWLAFIDGDQQLPGGSVIISASVELDDRPGTLRDFVQAAQRDLISNIEKAATIAVEEGEFRRDLDCEQFAWSLYSFVLGYHHFSRMLQDPKAELHLMRSVHGLFAVAREGARIVNGSREGARIVNRSRESARIGNGSRESASTEKTASAKNELKKKSRKIENAKSNRKTAIRSEGQKPKRRQQPRG